MTTSNTSAEGRFKRVARWIPVVVSVGLLAALVSQVDPRSFANIRLEVLGPAIVLALVLNAFLGAWKWRRVIALSGVDLPYRQIWKLWVGLYPLTTFAPFQSGHLLYAIVLRNATKLPAVQALESVAYDKYLSLVGTFGLIAIGQIALPDGHEWKMWPILAGSIAVLVVYAFDQRLIAASRAIPFIERHSRLLRRPAPLGEKGLLLGAAMLYQSSDLFSFGLACLALSAPLDPAITLGLYPLILLMTYVPISVNGFGVREGLVLLLLGDVLTDAGAIQAGLVVDLLEYLAPALLGLTCLRLVLANLGSTLSTETEAMPEEARTANP